MSFENSRERDLPDVFVKEAMERNWDYCQEHTCWQKPDVSSEPGTSSYVWQSK